MGEPVQQSHGELLVAKDSNPFAESKVGGDQRGFAFVAFGKQVEEKLSTDPIKRDKAKLIDNQELDSEQLAAQGEQVSAVAGLDKLLHKIGSSGEEDSSTSTGHLDTEGDGEMCFPGTDGTGEDDIFGLVEEIPRAECQELGLGDTLKGLPIDLV